MFKVKHKNARTTSVAFSGVCIVNFEHIEHSVSIADFQEVNLSQECSHHIEIRPLMYNADQLIGFYLNTGKYGPEKLRIRKLFTHRRGTIY